MAAYTTNDANKEEERFTNLGPNNNAAANALLHLCKTKSDNVDRMEDYWNAILYSYFPLTDGFMICRSTVQGFRTLTVAVAPKKQAISTLRVLMHVCFSHGDAEEPPFDRLCRDDFWRGHAGDAVLCMTLGATTFRPFLVRRSDGPGEESRRAPLKFEREGGGVVSFGDRFHRMDAEGDRRGLDEIFKNLHIEGAGNYIF